jgi:hypothetical protein
MGWVSRDVRRRRFTGLVLVLLVHLGVGWLAMTSLLGRHAAPLLRGWTVVRLLSAPVLPSRQQLPPAAAPRPRLPVLAAVPAPAPEVPSGAAAPPGPAVPGPSHAMGTPTGAGRPDDAGVGVGVSTLPLQLRPSREVLRGALANPATSDPRANSPRPTANERMAMAFDPTLCVLEERLPDGSVHRRWGRMARVMSAIEARTGHQGMDTYSCQ